jgi:ABC-type polysaccharide/polyol phosphate transport system ATPase subunit
MTKADVELARLRSELSRTIAHRCSLQEALAEVEAERNLFRSDNQKLRAEVRRTHTALESLVARGADLHGALNVVRAKNDRLEAALAAALQAAGEQAAAIAAPATAPPPPAPPAPMAGEPSRLRALPAPPVIEVRELSKAYRIPAQPVDTLKERVLHPFRSRRGTFVEALREVSFDVHRGEFLGIAGANGSGKSTLLKVLANVYAADSGTVRTAGRVAPFIELGVGLKPEFAAYDNVVISGVMMGLSPDEARAKYPEIIDFAGLQDFTEVKLKNYSSGMQVRLAFAVMAQVDADILLVDEVLAVGDAEFRAKCLARMNQLRSAGKTIVLVTHSMETIAKECDRGILLCDGEIRAQGDPAEVARRYMEEQVPDPTPPVPEVEHAVAEGAES